MKILCIDVGNTSAHYGLVTGQQILESGDFPTQHFRDGPAPAFAQRIRHLLDQADGIAFCSVVPAINKHLEATLSGSGSPLFHLNSDGYNGLALSYPTPREIGQDRLANAIAAQVLWRTGNRNRHGHCGDL